MFWVVSAQIGFSNGTLTVLGLLHVLIYNVLLATVNTHHLYFLEQQRACNINLATFHQLGGKARTLLQRDAYGKLGITTVSDNFGVLQFQLWPYSWLIFLRYFSSYPVLSDLLTTFTFCRVLM